jgi:hypothetical protein
MYLRFSQRANADGTVVRYVALAHNHRVDGKVKPDMLMNLGRVDRLEVDGLLRLAASIRKHFGDGSGLTDRAEAGAGGRCGADGGRRRPADRRRLAAGRAVGQAGDRYLDQADHRWPAVHHRGGAGAVRAGL